MEHVEVLRDLSEVCRAAIKAGDWKVDGACDPDSLLRHADAAIAALSAQQPPAEAIELTVCCGREECGGECGNEWRGMEWVRKAGTPPAEARECPHRTRCDCLASCKHGIAGDGAAPAEAQPVACSKCGVRQPLQHSPDCGMPVPSAPVGVEGFDKWFDEYTKNNYTDEMLAEAAWKAALARQPAAEGVQPEARGVVDEGSRSVTRQLLHWGGVPVHVTGTATTSPGNWSLIDAALAGQQQGGES